MAKQKLPGGVNVNCEQCERMTKAETEIANLKELTGGMDEKLDKVILEVAKSKSMSVILNIVSPLAVGLIVYLVTRGAH